MEKKLRFEERSIKERVKDIVLNTPGKEYREGQAPLEYHYEFPGGEKLEASQDEKGLGHIVIKRGGETIWDAASLLPEGFKFVTPFYFKNLPPEQVTSAAKRVMGTWAMRHDKKYIMLGEFKAPQDFLSLLHEIGHARSDTAEELAEKKQLNNKLATLELSSAGSEYGSEKTSILRELAKITNKTERRAWADALQMMRRAQNDAKANLRSLFPSFKDCKQYINSYLAGYRRRFEGVIKGGLDPDFYKELQTYFDKWQYEK